MDVCAFGSRMSVKKNCFPALCAMGWKFLGRDVRPDILPDVRGISRPNILCLGCLSVPERKGEGTRRMCLYPWWQSTCPIYLHPPRQGVKVGTAQPAESQPRPNRVKYKSWFWMLLGLFLCFWGVCKSSRTSHKFYATIIQARQRQAGQGPVWTRDTGDGHELGRAYLKDIFRFKTIWGFCFCGLSLLVKLSRFWGKPIEIHWNWHQNTANKKTHFHNGWASSLGIEGSLWSCNRVVSANVPLLRVTFLLSETLFAPTDDPFDFLVPSLQTAARSL